MENQLEQEIASHNQKPNVTRKDSTFRLFPFYYLRYFI